MEEEPKKFDKKSSKSRRETAVQGTNDSSIVSKCSMAEVGYFNDAYLRHFVSKITRRAPLIHRGYYIRAKTIDFLLRQFLKQHSSKKQIISLGAGFDSAYFRLQAAKALENVSFYEVDFPDVVRRKCNIIKTNNVLSDLIPGFDPNTVHQHSLIEIHTEDYTLLGVDLTQLNTLEALLKHCGIDFEVPTLLLSECVMTYMTRRCSSAVLKWASETFSNAAFILYEQIHPDDAFGIFMQKHFQVVGSPLKCITSFPTIKLQIDRCHKQGWERSEAMDMNQFYHLLVSEEEHRMVEKLEPFDEYEEWFLKCSHYAVICSYMGECHNLLSDDSKASSKLFSGNKEGLNEDTARVGINYPSANTFLLRFGHSSVRLHNPNIVVTMGGFGEKNGKHQRLIDVAVTDLNTYKTTRIFPEVDCKSLEVNRMHHVLCPLADGTILLIGGRTSPIKLCSQIVKLHISGLNSNSCQNDQSQISRRYPDHVAIVNNQGSENACSKCGETIKSVISKNAVESNCDVNKDVGNAADSKVTKHDTTTNSDRNVTKLMNSSYSRRWCEKGFTLEAGESTGNIKLGTESNENSLTTDLTTRKQLDIVTENLNDMKVAEEDVTGNHGNQEDNMDVLFTVMEQSGSIPKPRWRHSANAVQKSGKEMVFLFGGRTGDILALNDSFLLDVATGCWTELYDPDCRPEPRQAHSTICWQNSVIVSGGLNGDLQPLASIYILNLESGKWTEYTVKGNLKKRFSHTSHVLGDYLLLIGGVNTDPRPPGVAIIHLPSHQSMEFSFPEQDSEKLLMYHKHTTVDISGGRFVMIGGGGNCFSFGTHLNVTPVEIDLKDCLDRARLEFERTS